MTPRLRPSVTVAGTGICGPTTADERSIPEMVLHAVEQALEDAGMAHANVDAVVTASVDLYDGLAASNVAVTEVVGAVMKPETRIAADGLCAAIHGACQIWAEAYGTVLVVAHGKASMVDPDALSAFAMDPIMLQPLGVTFDVCAKLLAACGGGQATGLRRDRRQSPAGDGACAIVLRRADGPRPRIVGVGWDLDAHQLGDRDLACPRGWYRALERACATAGIEASAAGVMPPSDTGIVVPVASGLMCLAGASRWLREHPDAQRAVASGSWGPAGQGQAVVILEQAA